MGKRNICQTTGKSKTDDGNTANHRRAQNDNRERKNDNRDNIPLAINSPASGEGTLMIVV